jgi:hypothetical protein
MTVTENDGTKNDSDISELALALFVAGRSTDVRPEADGVEFITLSLEGEWAWPDAASDDEALQLIGLGIYEALLEAVAPYRDAPDGSNNAEPSSTSDAEI